MRNHIWGKKKKRKTTTTTKNSTHSGTASAWVYYAFWTVVEIKETVEPILHNCLHDEVTIRSFSQLWSELCSELLHAAAQSFPTALNSLLWMCSIHSRSSPGSYIACSLPYWPQRAPLVSQHLPWFSAESLFQLPSHSGACRDNRSGGTQHLQQPSVQLLPYLLGTEKR